MPVDIDRMDGDGPVPVLTPGTGSARLGFHPGAGESAIVAPSSCFTHLISVNYTEEKARISGLGCTASVVAELCLHVIHVWI